MAKRGETRPWRIRYQWVGTEIAKGTETRSSLDEAEAFAAQLERTSDLRQAPLAYTIQHRDQSAPARDVTHAPIEMDESAW